MARRIRSSSDKKEQKKIAAERIIELFKQAKLVFSEDVNLANRYVALARKMAMRYNIRIPRVLKRRFCKHCYHYLVAGKNCRVRTKDGKVVYTCFNCNKFMRFVIKK